jgi:hypothetical protein
MNKGFRKARHTNQNKENNNNISNLGEKNKTYSHLNFASLKKDN